MTIQLEDKDIVEIIRSALWNFAGLSKQKGIQLHFNANATSCVCKVDEDKIEKIITNLLSNALKNTPGGGEVNVGVQVDQSRIVMFVSDTGQGISADEIKHIIFLNDSLPRQIPC
jgi:signal transduction histidine kinase